jgi:hypothetical protein
LIENLGYLKQADQLNDTLDLECLETITLEVGTRVPTYIIGVKLVIGNQQ